MLEVGVKKLLQKNLSTTIEMILSDSENMPLRTTTLTQYCCFGVRNFEIRKGLAEIQSFETKYL
jgi:demethylmenaquinone methyltransferase/2-methoxy-6-polyprenyl-1,4-benzoquinol methylase